MSQGFTSGLPVPLPVSKGGTGVTGMKPVIQRVYTQYSAAATGTTTMPIDDTIPQNTEGTEVMTRAITPTNASNILQIEAVVYCSASILVTVTAALFQDSTADALAVASFTIPADTYLATIPLTYNMAAGTTSSTTFKVRLGMGSASTVTFNGIAGTRRYGATTKSSISIMEYAV